MKIFGKTSAASAEPSSLEEVTLVLTRDEVSDLVRFLSACAEEMKTNPEWEHVHLSDFLGKKHSGPELIIFAADKLNQ